MNDPILAVDAARIELANVKDLPGIERLLDLVWPDWPAVLKRPLLEIMASPQERILTARRGVEICGCIVLSDGPHYSCLHALAVAPNTRRRGVGSALISGGVSLQQELNFVGLPAAFVLADSPQARLFDKVGFSAVPYGRSPPGHQLVVRAHAD